MANFYSKKVCRFCAEKIDEVDYKDVKLLQRYLNSYGKIETRKRTGTCLRHQRRVAVALKRSRHLALLPFVVR
jgi:small subunit ribosomal protein S18